MKEKYNNNKILSYIRHQNKYNRIPLNANGTYPNSLLYIFPIRDLKFGYHLKEVAEFEWDVLSTNDRISIEFHDFNQPSPKLGFTIDTKEFQTRHTLSFEINSSFNQVHTNYNGLIYSRTPWYIEGNRLSYIFDILVFDNYLFYPDLKFVENLSRVYRLGDVIKIKMQVRNLNGPNKLHFICTFDGHDAEKNSFDGTTYDQRDFGYENISLGYLDVKNKDWNYFVGNLNTSQIQKGFHRLKIAAYFIQRYKYSNRDEYYESNRYSNFIYHYFTLEDFPILKQKNIKSCGANALFRYLYTLMILSSIKIK